ncbi:hypothetical protein ACHQM5_006789 [Ranunculus cassubicifolius]
MEEMKTVKTKTLPHDVVIQILSRLPAQYLWPFRCVSKSWLHLLTRDLQFANLHFHRSIKLNTNNPSILASRAGVENTSLYLASEYTACDEAIELSLPWLSGKATIMGICNGMLCLKPHDGYNVFIWNPLTGDHINIPSTRTTPLFPDSYIGAPGFGFGFHEGTNQYKVIKVLVESDFRKNDHHTQVSVYTLGVDTEWRSLEDDIPHKLDIFRTTKPVVDGSFHWLAGGTGMTLSPLIVALDLREEIFQEFIPPKVVDLGDSFPSDMIGELGGLLGYFCAVPQRNVQIWVMYEYGEVDSWTKLFVVGSPEVSGAFTYLHPLGLLNSSEVFVIKNDRELIVYNRETNSITNLEGFGFGFYMAYLYIGSIISPRHISNGAHIQT